MKSTEREPQKTAVKAATKAKKPKARPKKTSSKQKQNGPKRKRSRARKLNHGNDGQPTKQRRSDRNRNNHLNYLESSDDESDQQTWTRYEYDATKRKSKRNKRTAASMDHNPNDNEDNWVVYDRSTMESDGSWNEHYRRLQEFHSEHGHSGVPVGELWNDEPDFCEWVLRERQLFREIRSGYRIASLREVGRWNRLRVLEFPLDYHNWLWTKRYNQLCEALNGHKYNEKQILLPSVLEEWVERQRVERIDSEQRTNLEKLGIVVGPAREKSLALGGG